MPDLGHIVPIINDAVLDGVGQLEDTLLGLGLLPHIRLLVVHTHHDVFVLGPADDRGEGGPRGVIARKTSLAHTRSVVNHHGRAFLLSHSHQIIMRPTYLVLKSIRH